MTQPEGRAILGEPIAVESLTHGFVSSDVTARERGPHAATLPANAVHLHTRPRVQRRHWSQSGSQPRSQSRSQFSGCGWYWRLQSIDGRPLPFTLPEEESGGADKLEVTAEVITTLESGSFTMLTAFRVTDGSDVFPESIPDKGDLCRQRLNGDVHVLQ